MTVPARHSMFIVPPESEPDAASFQAAFTACRDLLAVTVAVQPDCDAALTSRQAFFDALYSLADACVLAGLHNEPTLNRLVWELNVCALTIAAGGVTANNVRQQHAALMDDPTDGLALRPDVADESLERFRSLVHAAIATMLQNYWSLLTEAPFSHDEAVSGVARAQKILDQSWFTKEVCEVLTREFPLQGTHDVGVWEFNIRRLTLQLLGYKPQMQA